MLGRHASSHSTTSPGCSSLPHSSSPCSRRCRFGCIAESADRSGGPLVRSVGRESRDEALVYSCLDRRFVARRRDGDRSTFRAPVPAVDRTGWWVGPFRPPSLVGDRDPSLPTALRGVPARRWTYSAEGRYTLARIDLWIQCADTEYKSCIQITYRGPDGRVFGHGLRASAGSSVTRSVVALATNRPCCRRRQLRRRTRGPLLPARVPLQSHLVVHVRYLDQRERHGAPFRPHRGARRNRSGRDPSDLRRGGRID